MLSLKQQLLQQLKRRLKVEAQETRALKFLLEIDIDKSIDDIIAIVYTYTRSEKGKQKAATFAEVITAIGFAVRNRNKLAKDTLLASKAGGFFLWSFEDLGMVRVRYARERKKKHTFLAVDLVSEKLLRDLYSTIPIRGNNEKLPSIVKHPLWETTVNKNGAYLVKTTNKYLNKVMNAERYDIVFGAINKSQETGWNINESILETQQWALASKKAAFRDIWEATSKQAQLSKFRESRAIIDIARRFINKTFYHLFYLDFRGRAYPATAYLHHQGSDVARGLLLRDDKAPLGEHGYKWLLVSAANNWGGDSGRVDGKKTDKIPILEREAWALENLDNLIGYAQYPRENMGWMEADKPWQFLAVCLELHMVKFHLDFGHPLEEYESNLEVYLDGTCNGHQHLAALTKDETIAAQVNLTPSKYPADLYGFVARNVWAEIENRYQMLSPQKVQLGKEYLEELNSYKEAYHTAKGSDAKNKTRAELIAFKEVNKKHSDYAAIIFWREVKDSKERRKVVKRNVMTIPYGASAYGLGEQIIQDSKRYGIPYLYNIEYKFASYLGRLVYTTCTKHLARSIDLLNHFEDCGKEAEMRNDYLSWVVPLTGFPVTQHYIEGKVKKTWIQYGPREGEKLKTNQYSNTKQVLLSYLEQPIPSRNKQAQGAAPNIIHSLDAAHLAFTVASSDYPITTIHDSFGALAGHTEYLYKHVRSTFVFLYEDFDPLNYISESIDLEIDDIDRGTYEVKDTLESEYAFS